MAGKDYCDYKLVLELKELGYDYIRREGLIHLYDAQKWLREEKGIIVGIINNFTTKEFDYYISTWDKDRCTGNKYTSYENALLRGIKEAIKILKDE